MSFNFVKQKQIKLTKGKSDNLARLESIQNVSDTLKRNDFFEIRFAVFVLCHVYLQFYHSFLSNFNNIKNCVIKICSHRVFNIAWPYMHHDLHYSFENSSGTHFVVKYFGGYREGSLQGKI